MKVCGVLDAEFLFWVRVVDSMLIAVCGFCWLGCC